jgi:hypothetical protein
MSISAVAWKWILHGPEHRGGKMIGLSRLKKVTEAGLVDAMRIGRKK